MTRAEVLAIGDELVRGDVVDTNSAWIARSLAQLGIDVLRVTVVGDGTADLADAMALACNRADLVIATGGLGPTDDDRTRDAAAQAGGAELYFDEDAWRDIEELVEAIGKLGDRQLPTSNRRQAMFPRGCRILANAWGTAPGFAQRIGRATLFALPGVPREMKEMWRALVQPELEPAARGQFVSWRLHVIGLREADLGERISEFMAEGLDPRVGITASQGQLTVRITGQQERTVNETAALLRPLIGKKLIYEGHHSLAEEVGRRLISARTTLALAESCTGGMLAAALTEVPGISSVLRAGFVTYSDEAKTRDLGVSAALLAEFGAVSTEVAVAMAEGAATRVGTDLAVAITGVAGPGGGTGDKPVGTVCFAVTGARRTLAVERRFTDLGREFVRRRSVLEALVLITRLLESTG